MPGNQNRVGVLCIHGIQGSPRQFDWIIAALPAHAAVENLLLPGHGGDVRAFRQSNMRLWQACVDDALNRMRTRCDSILVVGHSMGCLLAMDACLRNAAGVKALVLLACPLRLRPTLRYVRNAVRAAAKWHTDDPFVAAAIAANGVSAAHPLAYLGCTGPYMQLLAKIPKVRRDMKGLKMPVLAMHSDRDEIVSEKSLEYIRRLPGGRACIAPESGHFRYGDEAKALILRSILDLL